MKKEYTKIREQFQWAARKRKSRAKINNASKGRANDSAEHGLSEIVRDPDTSTMHNSLNGGNNLVSEPIFANVAFIELGYFSVCATCF